LSSTDSCTIGRDNDVICLSCAVPSAQLLIVVAAYVFMQSLLKDLPKF
jgi:hypothetical protein